MYATAKSPDPFATARAELQRRVAWHAVRGAVIVRQDPASVVLVYRGRMRHDRHRTATAWTLGLWAPFWAAYTMAARLRRRGVVLTIDKYGLLHEEAARRKAGRA